MLSSITASTSRRWRSRPGCSRSRSTLSTPWRSTCGSRPARSAMRSRSSRVFNAFAMATPGMRELLTHRQGLGAGAARAPHPRRSPVRPGRRRRARDRPRAGHPARRRATFAEIAMVGPIAQQGADDRRHDRRPVSSPASSRSRRPRRCPSSETLALNQALEQDGLALDAVVLNARLPERFGDDGDLTALNEALARPAEPHTRAALRAALVRARPGRHPARKPRPTRRRSAQRTDRPAVPVRRRARPRASSSGSPTCSRPRSEQESSRTNARSCSPASACASASGRRRRQDDTSPRRSRSAWPRAARASSSSRSIPAAARATRSASRSSERAAPRRPERRTAGRRRASCGR